MIGQMLLGIALICIGAIALKHSWSAPRKEAWRRLFVLAGWVAFALGSASIVWGSSVERGLPYGTVVLGLVGLVLVIANYTRRPDKSVRDPAVLEPSDRKSRIWRGVMRVLLAGPISGIAAIGVGIAIAVKAPMVEADRLIIGGAFSAFLWAGGMAWTLSDDRILRAAAVLIGVGAVSFTIGMI